MRVVEDPLNRETIQAITQLIVERFEPEQVILFGSCARGEEDENSDLDLLVVLRPGQKPPHRGNPIRRAIADHFVLPVDLLIRSYETFAKYRPNPTSMLSRMLEDSEVLYDRHADRNRSLVPHRSATHPRSRRPGPEFFEGPALSSPNGTVSSHEPPTCQLPRPSSPQATRGAPVHGELVEQCPPSTPLAQPVCSPPHPRRRQLHH